jgi:hypothetical protein
MSTLDFVAAAAVARARLMERAVHDRGPWQVEVAGVKVDAVKVRTPTRVIFLAHFEQVPDGDTDVAWLYCQGDPISSKNVSVPVSGPFCIEWAIIGPSVSETVGA